MKLYIKILLGFIMVATLLNGNLVEAKSTGSWKKVEVRKILDNERILLKDNRIIEIIGINSPSKLNYQDQHQCYAYQVQQTLKSLLNKKVIKIKEDEDVDQYRKNIFPRHVKLETGEILSELMVRNGWAKADLKNEEISYFKRLKKAEGLAQENIVGIWQGCGTDNARIFTKNKIGSRMRKYRKNYGQYLSQISVGRVIKVLSGNEFVLNNGVKVKMLGTEVPSSADDRPIFACFGKKSQNYLEHLILRKKVFLKRDISDLDDNYFLQRYVYLPPETELQRETFINKKMVADGYARSFWDSEVDDDFKDDFEKLQNEVYENPTGAWVTCLGESFNTQEVIKKEKKDEKVLVYDEDCRIKGNISGSKKKPVKTYHTPRSPWYKRLKHEACFEDEGAAEAEGFVKVK